MILQNKHHEDKKICIIHVSIFDIFKIVDDKFDCKNVH